MTVGLLDVNVLVALAWPSHVHHREAHIWFDENQMHGWATCPLTQCGFVRISSNPRIIREAVSPIEALVLLKEMTSLDHHDFWPDDAPFHEESFPTELLVGHRQVTDAYLLGLAIRHKGKLVTLDQSLSGLLPASSPHRVALEVVSVKPGR
ncbi:MAG: VapC toxin family PIN domain ribonuclease [Candidatus Omnitrophica bacterium]|nr:VapC toxin family PIN domain ribonuclease [Candidatus Omnitrophota bacterium]